jgi:hypothetical protein
MFCALFPPGQIKIKQGCFWVNIRFFPRFICFKKGELAKQPLQFPLIKNLYNPKLAVKTGPPNNRGYDSRPLPGVANTFH